MNSTHVEVKPTRPIHVEMGSLNWYKKYVTDCNNCQLTNYVVIFYMATRQL